MKEDGITTQDPIRIEEEGQIEYAIKQLSDEHRTGNQTTLIMSNDYADTPLSHMLTPVRELNLDVIREHA